MNNLNLLKLFSVSPGWSFVVLCVGRLQDAWREATELWGGLQHLLPVVHQELHVWRKQRRTTGLHRKVLNWCFIWKPLESLMVFPRVTGERAFSCNAVVFGVWAFCQPVSNQTLCCLVLGISVACLFSVWTGRWITPCITPCTTAKLTQEIFSWR